MKIVKIIIYIAVFLVLLEAGYFFGKYTKTSPQESKPATISADILSITQPVYSFSGTIDSIKGNTITVKQQITLNSLSIQTIPTGQTLPTPMVKILVNNFVVKENTQISMSSLPVNYLFKNLIPTLPPKLTINNLRTGQQVTIQTNSDLRLNSATIPEALSVNIRGKNNLFTGKITEVNEKNIKMLVYLPYKASIDSNAIPPQQTIEYSISITSDTEISRYAIPESGTANNLPKPEKLSLSDLKKDMQANVYIQEDDISSSPKFTALRIEPFYIPPINPSPILPSVSPIIAPDLSVLEATSGPNILLESPQASPSNL